MLLPFGGGGVFLGANTAAKASGRLTCTLGSRNHILVETIKRGQEEEKASSSNDHSYYS